MYSCTRCLGIHTSAWMCVSVQDYSPRYCLELLALPLDDSHQKQRQRGMTLLRKLAFELPQDLSPVAQQERDSFLSSARSLLTPQELVRALVDTM